LQIYLSKKNNIMAMKKTTLILGLTIMFILIPVLSAIGQPPPPPPQDIPIDGGLVSLLLGGVALVVKTFFSKKNNK